MATNPEISKLVAASEERHPRTDSLETLLALDRQAVADIEADAVSHFMLPKDNPAVRAMVRARVERVASDFEARAAALRARYLAAP